jgi:hypothetical protein
MKFALCEFSGRTSIMFVMVVAGGKVGGWVDGWAGECARVHNESARRVSVCVP